VKSNMQHSKCNVYQPNSSEEYWIHFHGANHIWSSNEILRICHNKGVLWSKHNKTHRSFSYFSYTGKLCAYNHDNNRTRCEMSGES